MLPADRLRRTPFDANARETQKLVYSMLLPIAGARTRATRMYASCTVLTVALAASMAVHWVISSRHWVLAPPEYWEKYAHAHYHLAQSLSLTLGLCVVAMIVVWGPFRRRDRWSWWVLLAVGTCL